MKDPELFQAIDTMQSVKEVKKLLDQKANPNARDDSGNTPLHAAASTAGRGQQYIEELVKRRADINARNTDGETPLHHSVQGAGSGTAETLLEKRADPNAQDNFQRTPLHKVAGSPFGQAGDARSLIEKKADIGVKDGNGESPLDIAQKVNPIIAQILQEREEGRKEGSQSRQQPCCIIG